MNKKKKNEIRIIKPAAATPHAFLGKNRAFFKKKSALFSEKSAKKKCRFLPIKSVIKSPEGKKRAFLKKTLPSTPRKIIHMAPIGC